LQQQLMQADNWDSHGGAWSGWDGFACGGVGEGGGSGGRDNSRRESGGALLGRVSSSTALLATSSSALFVSNVRSIADQPDDAADVNVPVRASPAEFEGTWMMGGRAVTPDDADTVRAALGYGTYARFVERAYSDASLHFSSGPPSPAPTPPSSVGATSHETRAARPRREDFCKAEMLTELF
jgi:hypothetical protein